MTATAPTSGYRPRPLEPGDVGRVFAVLRACEQADYGEVLRTEGDVAAMFGLLDLEHDALLVETRDARPAAYAVVRRRGSRLVSAFVGVAPEHRGRGLGTRLADRAERRARELFAARPADGEALLGQGVGPHNDSARRLLQARGYEHVRRFWEMAIELGDPPPEARLPDGLEASTLADGGDVREVYDLIRDAFSEHWGYADHDYDEWRAWLVDRPEFDPSLWLLVRAGGELAGGSLCQLRPDGSGWIGVLGVRRAHRRHGVGLALLQRSFAELRRRGAPRAGLGVDSENTTGATELYARAGMHVARHDDAYHKVL